jgi:hypothetical protein
MSTLEISGDLAICDLSGSASLEDAVRLVAEAITEARELRLNRLLVDLTRLRGFEPPSLGERYFLVRRWADAAAGAVCVAFVTRAEMIDRERFGVRVAKNRGFRANVFARRDEALAWLESS